MYSGKYDVCDVTMSVYPHQKSLKYMPDHGGNRTYAFGMLSQSSVLVCDILELSLVSSISMQSSNTIFSVLVLCTQVNMMFLMSE
jgi:hypothetical protein